MGLSLLEIIIYAALAVIAVFAIVMLIISAVFAKRHRDPDVCLLYTSPSPRDA